MPLRSVAQARQRAQAGVVVCSAHWPDCPKYPDHPLIRERNKPDMELAQMIRAGNQKMGKPISEYPKECKTRKLSDDELRQRREYAEAVRESRSKKGNHPDPTPPWEEFDPELAKLLGQGVIDRHTTDVREGYGDAVPEFEEE